MSTLLLGLLIFFGIHLLPTFQELRHSLQVRLGALGYRASFSLVAAVGLTMVVLSYAPHAGDGLLPDDVARQLARMMMPLAMVLIASSQLPGRLRLWLRHPMLLGVLLWALCHILANGNHLSAQILFGSFAVYSVVAIWLQHRRGWVPSGRGGRWRFDALALVAGVLVEELLRNWHGLLFGVGLV